jgi:hypothetical protein
MRIYENGFEKNISIDDYLPYFREKDHLTEEDNKFNYLSPNINKLKNNNNKRDITTEGELQLFTCHNNQSDYYIPLI